MCLFVIIAENQLLLMYICWSVTVREKIQEQRTLRQWGPCDCIQCIVYSVARGASHRVSLMTSSEWWMEFMGIRVNRKIIELFRLRLPVSLPFCRPAISLSVILLSVYLQVCLFACMSVYLHICLFACLSICRKSICLSVILLPVYLSACLYHMSSFFFSTVFLSVYLLAVRLLACMPICRIYICLCVYLSSD